MSKNKIKKTVSLNITNPDDAEIIKKISEPNFNFNEWARKLMLEDIRREKNKIVHKSEKGGIKIVLG
ncbi:hypothetical protein AS180_17885 [Priestia veravalensis]|uniref:Uncharacterized protein n=1 Tax=Priestia veravalensis TaxID=1414648 RepID=A0A0V8JIR4_9BACI|nr:MULTISPECIES: hypothetical protein [Priestia]KSU86560.1 hypothetical protein AS180_17885 [Priestia veravalensis]SCC50682.1 hypothetical protein GA0061087_10668 [Priestia flexa]